MNNDDLLETDLIFRGVEGDANWGWTVEEFFEDEEAVESFKDCLSTEDPIGLITDYVIEKIRDANDIDLACDLLREFVRVVPEVCQGGEIVKDVPNTKYFY